MTDLLVEVCRRWAAPGWILAGRAVVRSEAPLDPAGWTNLRSRAVHEGVVGHLAEAVRTGMLPVTDDQAAELAAEHRAAMALALELERLLLVVDDRLATVGVSALVLKGPALAHLLGDPSVRAYRDLDLLVRGAHMPIAAEVLAGLGAERRHRALRGDYDARFAKSVTWRMPEGYEIDLHRTLAPGPFGVWCQAEDLFDEATGLALGPAVPATAAPADHLTHALYHAALGDRRARLVSLTDIVALGERADLDWSLVRRRLERWQGAAVAAEGLARVADRFGSLPEPLSDLADGLAPEPRHVALLDAYRRGGSRYRGLAVDTVRALPTWRDRLAYLRAHFP